MKIEGVPEGYELVRVGVPKVGELYIDTDRSITETMRDDWVSDGICIVRKIEPTTRPMTRDEFLKAWKERGWCPVIDKAGDLHAVGQFALSHSCTYDVRFDGYGWITLKDATHFKFASDNSPLTVTE